MNKKEQTILGMQFNELLRKAYRVELFTCSNFTINFSAITFDLFKATCNNKLSYNDASLGIELINKFIDDAYSLSGYLDMINKGVK